jgi:hypothetical protein
VAEIVPNSQPHRIAFVSDVVELDDLTPELPVRQELRSVAFAPHSRNSAHGVPEQISEESLQQHHATEVLMLFPAMVLSGLLWFAPAQSPVAQIPPELRLAMQARLEAVWKKDAATWSRLTAEEFTVVVPEGTLMTKADRLAALKTEKPEPVHAIEREQIQTYGESVVRRFMDGNEWVLEIWVRQRGSWQVVAAQVNLAKR